VDLAKFLLQRALLVKAKENPSYISKTLIPTLEISISIIKVLEKLGMAKIRVEHMENFSQ